MGPTVTDPADRLAAGRSRPADTAPAERDGVPSGPIREPGDRSGSEPPSAGDAAADPTRRSLVAVALVVAGAAALVAARPLGDNSFLTHLATGRLILADGLPDANPFLYTGTDFPVPSWWWSVLIGVAEELAGPTGLRLLTAAVAAVLAAVLVRLGRPTGPGAEPRLLQVVLPAVLALLCVLPFLSGRPHLAGYLLLALAVLVWNERRSPWWLVPLLAVWVNVHGSWLYGVALVGALTVARAVDDRRFTREDVGRVLAPVAGVVLGGALYPTAFTLVLLPTRQVGDPVEREALSAYREWARVPVDNPILWAMLLLAVIALVGALRGRRWATAALVVAIAAMGWSGSRLVPVAAVSLVPFAAAALRDVGQLVVPVGRAARATAAAGVAVLIATVGYVVATPDYRLDRFPVGAVDWLDERALVASDENVVSHDYVGNYLEWRYGERANAFVDDRPDAETLIDYRRMLRGEDGWRAAFERAEPDVVLWEADEELTAALGDDPAWVRVHESDGFVVFCAADLAERCT